MNKNAPHEKQIASVKGYLKGLASQGTVNIFPTVCDPDSIRAVAEVAKRVIRMVQPFWVSTAKAPG